MRSAGIMLLLAGLVGCGGKETIIVVKEAPTPTDNKPVATNAPETTGAGNNPVAGQPGDPGGEWGIRDRDVEAEYGAVVDKVATMVSDRDLVQRVQRRSMTLVNVMWEDTGRSQGSSLGPNISDLTLQVRHRRNGHHQTQLMPVIRPPNFTDRTGDIPADKFFVRVGNQSSSGDLTTVLLTDVLRDIKKFASIPNSIVGDGNMLDARDTHFLVSAQAVFLPIPKTRKAEFNPALFNYQ